MRACPECGARAVEFIAEASGDVCLDCGHTADVVVLDGSKDIADGHGLTLWPDGMATVLQPLRAHPSTTPGNWLAQSRDPHNARLLRDQDQLREIRRFIKGALAHLNRHRYADRAFGLFDVVRRAALERTRQVHAFWTSSSSSRARTKTPTLISWGLKANALAIASVYATIATSEPAGSISLQQVLHASAHTAHRPLDFHKVAKRLRLVRAFGGPAYAHLRDDAPRFYLDAVLDFFEALRDRIRPPPSTRKGKARDHHHPVLTTNADLASFLPHTSPARARTFAHLLATTLEHAHYPPPPGPTLTLGPAAAGAPLRARESAMHMHLTAYAIAMWALEASAREAGPQKALIGLSPYAIMGARGVDELEAALRRRSAADASEDEDDAPPAGSATNSKTTLQLRYSDIRKILSDAARHIPWVLAASVLASGRRRHRPPAPSKKHSDHDADAGDGAAAAAAAAAADVDDALELSRLDVVRWMSDILVFREAAIRRKAAHERAKAEEAHADGPVAAAAPDAADRAKAPITEEEWLRSVRGSGPIPPAVDSDVVARFKQRLLAERTSPPPDARKTRTGGRGSHSADAAAALDADDPDPSAYPDHVLFDPAEAASYLRSPAERALVEATLRAEGLWALDEARERARLERERVRGEREAARRSKVVPVGRKRGRSGKGTGKGARGKAPRRTDAAGTASERTSPASDEDEDDGDDAGSDADEDAAYTDFAWARPVDFSAQTEGWSDSSAEEDSGGEGSPAPDDAAVRSPP